MKRVVGKLAAVFLLMASSAHASTPTLASSQNPASIVKVQLESAAFASDRLKANIHLPPGYGADSTARYPVLYLNDGQDAAAVGLEDALATLYAQDAIEKIIVVAVDMLPDRMGTYGLSDRKAGRSTPGDSRYGAVGSRAHDYSEWVAHELVPYVDARYRTRPEAADRTVLGWSLGGLNAFNLGWQYPEVFGQVGAFSPSFWLASDRTDAASVQRSRLAQRMVEAGPKRAGSKFWFAVGTAEETDDRDGDGVIDAVDDTQDMARALARIGYTNNLEYARHVGADEVALYLLEGGEHNQDSWARMLPVFLRWAYGKVDVPTIRENLDVPSSPRRRGSMDVGR